MSASLSTAHLTVRVAWCAAGTLERHLVPIRWGRVGGPGVGAWCSDPDPPGMGEKGLKLTAGSSQLDRTGIFPSCSKWGQYTLPGTTHRPASWGRGARPPQVAWVMSTQATIIPGVPGQSQGLRKGLGMLSALHGLGGVGGWRGYRNSLLLMDPRVSVLSCVQSHGL